LVRPTEGPRGLLKEFRKHLDVALQIHLPTVAQVRQPILGPAGGLPSPQSRGERISSDLRSPFPPLMEANFEVAANRTLLRIYQGE
jgi:hypothetical protein